MGQASLSLNVKGDVANTIQQSAAIAERVFYSGFSRVDQSLCPFALSFLAGPSLNTLSVPYVMADISLDSCQSDSLK